MPFVFATFDKAGELFAPGFCPCHEALGCAIKVTTVMLHSDCGALEIT